MAARPPAAGGNAALAPGERQAETSMLTQGMKYVAMFVGTQIVMRMVNQQLGTNKPAAPRAPAASPGVSPGAVPLAGSTVTQPSQPLRPLWPLGTPMSLLVYTSEHEYPFTDFAAQQPIVNFESISYGDWKAHREAEVVVDIPASVQRNGSFYAHSCLVAREKVSGEDVVRLVKEDERSVACSTKELSRYFEKAKVKKVKKLIGGKAEDEEEVKEEVQPIISHWAPNMTITIISNGGELKNDNPLLKPILKTQGDAYYPPLFVNDFWLLKEEQLPINSTTPKLPLRITYDPIGMMKFNIYASLAVAWDPKNKDATGANPSGPPMDPDEIKKLLLSANPYWAAITAVLSILHMIFEMLAFKSDIGHWRKSDKDLVGVSLRTIITNVFTQLIILLYLLDASEQTSKMILFTNGMGVIVEAWKITKVLKITYHPPTDGATLPSITFEDKHELSEDEKKTKEYDALAFRMVGYVALPALIAYAGYSLNNHTFKSWYSFIIITLAEAVYMFSFANLIPQLIINYKLKSVSHLPLKAFVYKAISTVVDDAAAFVIKQPFLHRLACFRDDVVFVILLYQMYIYKTDYSRANEYGQVMNAEETKKIDGDGEGKIEDEGEKLRSGVAVAGKVLREEPVVVANGAGGARKRAGKGK